MMMKIRIVVLAFLLPFFMTACSSSSGSSGVVILDATDVVSQGFVHEYSVAVISGKNYDFDLDSLSGDADLLVCNDYFCGGFEDSDWFEASASGNGGFDTLNITFGYTGVAYIKVIGYTTASYNLTVYEY